MFTDSPCRLTPEAVPERMPDPDEKDGPTVDPSPVSEGAEQPDRFAPAQLYRAAQMYYLEDSTQADVARRLGTSRATVSRLLSEARRQGIVRIEVVPPSSEGADDLASRVASVLGVDRVFLSEPLPAPTGTSWRDIGSTLAPAVSRALTAVGMNSGEVLLVSSGRTVYEVARAHLARIPGVIVVPTIGGHDQPEEWYQTNEITRLMAKQLEGRPMYLFAPALPGLELHPTLRADPAIQRVLKLWPRARCVLTGVGASPMLRTDLPQFVPDSEELRAAVGDVCSRFFDQTGAPVDYPGSERLLALELDALRQIPVSIAVASGRDKIEPIIVAARAGYVDQLVTDPVTARGILEMAGEMGGRAL